MGHRKLGCLGPEGTYSEEAALIYAPEGERILFPSIPQVTEAVKSRAVAEAVVPIENSQQGSVTDVLDFLIQTDEIKIKHELAIQVNHCLMVRPGSDPKAVRAIQSHPQALGQCRGYLATSYPGLELIPSLSTAGAVSDMMGGGKPVAAIAPKRVAEMYGAEIVAEAIQDKQRNFTRFVVLADRDHERTGRDKTSIAFSFDVDGPGLLYHALGVFATRELNLTKIESRPTGDSLGSYIFLADIEGHRVDHSIARALGELKSQASVLKVFGSYPRMDPPTRER